MDGRGAARCPGCRRKPRDNRGRPTYRTSALTPRGPRRYLGQSHEVYAHRLCHAAGGAPRAPIGRGGRAGGTSNPKRTESECFHAAPRQDTARRSDASRLEGTDATPTASPVRLARASCAAHVWAPYFACWPTGSSSATGYGWTRYAGYSAAPAAEACPAEPWDADIP